MPDERTLLWLVELVAAIFAGGIGTIFAVYTIVRVATFAHYRGRMAFQEYAKKRKLNQEIDQDG